MPETPLPAAFHMSQSNTPPIHTWPDCVVLYKYMGISAFESTLDSWSLKACIPYEANDIMELTPQAISPNTRYMAMFNSPQCSPPPFLCFSRNITTPAMWGHYADSGKGVCLVFCFPVQDKEWKHDIVATESLHFSNVDCTEQGKESLSRMQKAMLSPILYSDERVNPPVSLENAPACAIEKWFHSLITTKGKSWEYEEEIRLIADYEDSDGVAKGLVSFSWPMNYLVGVVTGPRCQYSPAVVRGMLKTAYNNRKDNYFLEKFSTIFPNFICTPAFFHWQKFEIEAAPWGNRLHGMKTLCAYAAYLARLANAALPTLDADSGNRMDERYTSAWNDDYERIFQTHGEDVLAFTDIPPDLIRKREMLSSLGIY